VSDWGDEEHDHARGGTGGEAYVAVIIFIGLVILACLTYFGGSDG
jgi:hypothetical protein